MKLNGECCPKKAFVYNQFNDYLTGLLSRRDIKTMMDEACDNLLASLSSPQPRFIKNPFEAKFLHEFSSPKSGKLFIDRGEEGRYAFALHVDFFNPEGMNLRGASTSSGIISMACLNLLLNIRYKPENMYLAGIIPGPKQPSLENLNHYVHPLILDLATSWERGVWYSRTANHPNGRLTCCAIALAVCDLPAARHLAVLAGVGSHFFCSACSCYHTNNYGRVDFENWVPRDPCELHTFAEQWRDATTTAHCEKIFREHGLVVDSMHCILEGLVQHHIRSLLGLTTESTLSTQTSPPAFHLVLQPLNPHITSELTMTTKEMSQVSAIQALLVTQVALPDDPAQVHSFMEKLQEALGQKNLHSLQYVCKTLDCMLAKRTRLYKVDYVKALVQWHSRKPLSAEHRPKLNTSEVLARIPQELLG
ncbi:hypothetical protein M404DRAFT_32877 [Pisolithus tinctorius Marx 270]|uniref:Uncharacterized protein n=1 Tax=Pisolithus tinctorius Marx 270 TaxID=870435 RepID=A0A0C3N716_PISTI|nr:hypothetical protein M404DRAFT_32877 [Pisolithus tinctorius Marx 270]